MKKDPHPLSHQGLPVRPSEQKPQSNGGSDVAKIGAEKIEMKNVNHPGKATRVDADMYRR
jgi:hypothetical protein